MAFHQSSMSKPNLKSPNSFRELTNLFVEANLKLLSDVAEAVSHDHLSVPQFLIVSHLHDRDLTMSEISEILQVTNGAATGLVDRLEKRKVVQRVRSREDRRVVWVSITRAGKSLINRLQRSLLPDGNEEVSKSATVLKERIFGAK